MWRWPWSTFRTMVVSLPLLAPLFVYAVPAPYEHAAVATSDQAAAYLDHKETLCDDAGLLNDGVCCSVAQCAAMHGGLLPDVIEVFVPRLDSSTHLPAPGLSLCPAKGWPDPHRQ